MTKWAVAIWTILDAPTLALWNAYVDPAGRTGYFAHTSAFVRRCLNAPGAYIIPPGQPVVIDVTVPFATIMGPGSGSTVLDISEHQNHGALSGADWIMGTPGQALEFVAATDRVTVPYDDSLKVSSPYTMWAWVKITQANSYGCVFYQRGNPAGYSLEVNNWHVNALASNIDESPSSAAVEGSTAMQPDTWHFISLTYDGTLRIFLDGQLDGEVFWGKPMADTIPLDRFMGAKSSTGTAPFYGKIRGLGMQSQPLPASYLKHFYDKTKP